MPAASTRPLTSSDLRRVRADLARLRTIVSRERRLKELLQVLLLSLLAGASFGTLAGDRMVMVVAAFVCSGITLFALAWVQSSRRVRARSLQLRAAMGGNTKARVIHVRASAYAAFEEHEEVGNIYAFQTAPNELFVLNGPRYEETGAFPCLEFDVVEVPGSLVIIRPRSPRAEPSATYSEHETQAVAGVPDRSTWPGTLATAAQDLQQPAPALGPARATA